MDTLGPRITTNLLLYGDGNKNYPFNNKVFISTQKVRDKEISLIFIGLSVFLSVYMYQCLVLVYPINAFVSNHSCNIALCPTWLTLI